MTVLLLIISGSYALLTLLLWYGWKRISWPDGSAKHHRAMVRPTVQVSVIIPVRNEAQNLPQLLADLARQTYTHFEVIVADDSSTDDTVDRVQRLKNDLPYTLHLLPLTNERTGAPKKRAIAQSIRVAQGDLILTTDGDCRVGPDWIASFAQFYAQHQPKMITGPVTFTRDDISFREMSSLSHDSARDDISPTEMSSRQHLFAELQTVEFASLIGSGAATLRLGVPTMCNGANLCYEKRVFEEVNGFAGIDHVASGDDELLMHKIASRYPGGVRFLNDQRAIVRTAPHRTWGAFYQQRKRWASKWRAYASWQPSALAIFVFMSNITPIFAVTAGTAGLIQWSVVVGIIGLKTAPEFLFLRAVLRFLGQKRAVWWIPLTQFVYPFYVLFFGLAAQKKGFVWKGRSLK